jgi:hypothetical protein
MKYLRRYNESWSHDDVCKSLTGYSYEELKSIFELNLEDNGEFELTDIDGIINHVGPNDDEVMSLELIEDFGDNAEISNALTSLKSREIITDEIARINTKILYVIARKYDLDIYNIDVIDTHVGPRKRGFIIKFTVSKNTTVFLPKMNF